MSEKQIKGITCCGDCGRYDWKKHRCSLPCKDEGNPQSNFYADCPLPDVAPVAHGEWVEAKLNGMSLYPFGQKMCSVCGQIMPSQWETMPPFCYGCGAKMDAKSEVEK